MAKLLLALAVSGLLLGACALIGYQAPRPAASPPPGEPITPQSGLWEFRTAEGPPSRLRLTFATDGTVAVAEEGGAPSDLVTNTHGANRVQLSRCRPEWVRCDDIGYELVLRSPTRMEGVAYVRTDVQSMNREAAVEATLVP